MVSAAFWAAVHAHERVQSSVRLMEESEEEEVSELLDISTEELNRAFTSGLRNTGTDFLNALEISIYDDKLLTLNLVQILEGLKTLKAFVGGGGLHSSKISLLDLEDFNIPKESIRRIGILAFNIRNRSPEATAMTALSIDPGLCDKGSGDYSTGVLSADKSECEYEDDFEVHDDLDDRKYSERYKEDEGDRYYSDSEEFSSSYDVESDFNDAAIGGDSSEEEAYAVDEDYELTDQVENVQKVSVPRVRMPSAPVQRLTGSESAIFGEEATEVTSARRAASASGNRRRPKTASWIQNSKWVLGEKIGSGSFGEVFQGMNNLGRLFAVKRLHIAGQRDVVDTLANEIQLMRDYAHPNIVGYLGAEVDDEAGIVNIFQEWVPGGSLAHLLGRFGAFSDGVVANYTRQIVTGLQFLHSNGIIHRDIKGGNILVDEVGNVKLADFGASTHVNQFDKTVETYALKGTPYFMAPEVLGESRYGRKGDIWAVGCTMIQMLTGQPPWKDHNVNGIIQLHLLVSSWKGPPNYPKDNISTECQNCIEWCFRHTEAERPTAQELLQSDFLLQEEDLEDSSGNLLRNPGGAVDEDADDGAPDDSLEDSGVMTGLRMKMDRVAQSTDSLFNPIIPKNATAQHNVDTMKGVQNEIARRKLARKVVDVSSEKFLAPKPKHDENRSASEESDSTNADIRVITAKKAAVNPYARGAGMRKVNVIEPVDTSRAIAPEVKITKNTNRPGSKIPRPGRSNTGSHGVSSARDEDITPAMDDDSPLIASSSFRGVSNRVSDSIFRSDIIHDNGNDNDEDSWTCLACSKVNHEPGFCEFCAVVRGHSGKKGVESGIMKR